MALHLRASHFMVCTTQDFRKSYPRVEPAGCVGHLDAGTVWHGIIISGWPGRALLARIVTMKERKRETTVHGSGNERTNAVLFFSRVFVLAGFRASALSPRQRALRPTLVPSLSSIAVR